MGREIHLVAAARPNLPKLAALWHAMAEAPPLGQPVLVHTGQHHDDAMFGALLRDLDLPEPDVWLGIAGGSHAELTGRTMVALETLWRQRRPAVVIVPGDVDGALAAALAAAKLFIPVVHLEAGLRCDDVALPEEVNRRAIDAVATALWAPDAAAMLTLAKEGRAAAATMTGNAMIATLERTRPLWSARPGKAGSDRYGVLTLHRGANVDDCSRFARLLAAAGEAARRLDLIWPMHPRALACLQAQGLRVPSGIHLVPPLPYLDFIATLAGAKAVITDSGGVQEEATHLGIPCLTLRAATERPLTLTHGTNRLVVPDRLPAALEAMLADPPVSRPIPGWDALAGQRMRAALATLLLGGVPLPPGAPPRAETAELLPHKTEKAGPRGT